MPVRFQIFPQYHFVHVHYAGALDFNETLRAFGEYSAHPDFRPGQRQLVDLRELTSLSQDFLALMRLQAVKAEAFVNTRGQTLLAYLAGDRANLRLALLIQRSWEGIDGVVVRTFTDQDTALAFLGVPASALSEGRSMQDTAHRADEMRERRPPRAGMDND